VHTVYLGPSKELGKSEVAQIPLEDGEIAVSIAWFDLKTICENVNDFDSLFARSGLDCVLQTISNRKHLTNREWTEDEAILREELRVISQQVSPRLPNRQILTWGCELWAYGSITVAAKCVASATEEAECSGSHVQIQYSFRIAGKSDDRAHAKRWIAPVIALGEWNGFQPDERKNWMQRTASCPLGDFKESLGTYFEKLVGTIDREVANVKINQVD
jgi:hypothetical protein